MELEYRKLSEAEIASELETLPHWTSDGTEIEKQYGFDAYLDGLAFAGAVGFLAEKLDHHPDLHVGWRKVRVKMNTHAVDGLSPYDFELARRIEGLFGAG
jgi:4a-hydroxytetrahydrobiopterin dehydratase